VGDIQIMKNAHRWQINVTGGTNAGQSWHGDNLSECPAAILAPEGTSSARVQQGAERIRRSIVWSLSGPGAGRMTIGTASGGLEITRREDQVPTVASILDGLNAACAVARGAK
jgi:hypothetical protein